MIIGVKSLIPTGPSYSVFTNGALTIIHPYSAPQRRRLTTVHYVVGIAGILVCAWAAAQADAKAWTTLAALVAAGLLLYALASFGRRNSSQR